MWLWILQLNQFLSIALYTNKLSLNLRKTNYMVVTSPKKRFDINIQYIERKDHIKYLGVFIDNHIELGCPYTTCQ